MRRWAALFAVLTLALAPAGWARAQAPDPALIARAEAGDAEAAEELAFAYMELEDVENARRWARAAAEAGRAEGMNHYAAFLRLGDAAEQAEADIWEERAIAAGSRVALLNRGQRLIHSDSSEESWRAGFAMIAQFEHEQSAALLDEVARRYEEECPHASDQRVRELTALAAERGAAAAQWRYAMQLREGRGGSQDAPAAYAWARRSGEAGYLDGQISTAVMLATGEGVSEDDAEARAWYARAAERNSAHALRALGGMYITGEGGEVDAARGWAYVMLAAEGGDQHAAQFIERYGASAPEQTLRAAVEIRRAWLATRGTPE